MTSPPPEDMGWSVASINRITGSPVLGGIDGGVAQYVARRRVEHAAKRNHAIAEGYEYP
jgi:hypothetical protein